MEAMAAAVAIPLVTLVLPIALILLALLVDLIALVWFGYRMWHDEWSDRLGHLISDRVVRPVYRYIGSHGRILPH
jgi:hypothetical protein